MRTTIRLESEWGLEPFSIDRGDGWFQAIDSDTLAAMFGLPDHVMRTLDEWDQLYQDILDRSYPPDSAWSAPEDEQHYLERGRDAARLLRRHLPTDVRIEYRGYGRIPTEHY
jgi:cytochrome P450